MQTLAVIPARGGSKGIPQKNLKTIGGVPMVVRAIRAALAANRVDRVVVSTDDPEIARVAKEAGAEVAVRPVELATDKASSESALLHVLVELRRTEQFVPDLLVFLQCTSPLTLPEDIDGSITRLIDGGYDSLLSVEDFHYFIWTEVAGDHVGVNHDKSERLLRQQRKREYRENGAIYVMRTGGFVAARHRFFGRTGVYVMPSDRSMEIDDLADLNVAEALAANQRAHQSNHLSDLSQNLKLIVLDFDGVLTDNRVLVDADGREVVACNRSDGMRIRRLKAAGYRMLCLSSETNGVVGARCRKLDIQCIQGELSKWEALRDYLHREGIGADEAMYVGNDTNDLPCMQRVGFPVAVADARGCAQSLARHITQARGGEGVVGEIADLLLNVEA